MKVEMKILIGFFIISCAQCLVESAVAPYQALVQCSAMKNWLNIWSCGGVLIDQEYIITSASCTKGADIAHVKLGIEDLYGNSSFSRYVGKIIYPNSDEQSDIALLKLKGKLIPKNIPGVEIMKFAHNTTFGSEGTTGILSGWPLLASNMFVINSTFVKPCDNGPDLCTYGTYCLAAGSGVVVDNELVGISRPDTECDGTVVLTKVSDYSEWIENIVK